MKQKFLAGLLMILALFLFSTPAAAFTDVVAFGDSITDNGTSATDAHGFGTYTLGSPWADQLAGLHRAEIHNFAYGGARTGMGHLYNYPNPIPNPDNPEADPEYTPFNRYGVQWQVGQADIQDHIGTLNMDTTLFSVWAGPNDYNRLIALSGDTATAAQKQDAALTAVYNLSGAIETLINEVGAKHILVPNLMYLAPDGVFAGTFNFFLPGMLQTLSATYTETTFYTVDMNTLFDDLFFGYDIFNSNPDIAFTERLRAIGDGILHTDGYHPGTTTHAAMAQAAYDATVPVPAAFMLFASGLVALTGISRRKAA